jgi:AraC-like DNA-binding protein
VISHLLGGTAERTLNGRTELTHEVSPGDVLLGMQPGQSVVARTHDSSVGTVLVDPAVLHQLAGTMPTRPATALRFTGYRPVSAHAAAQWINTFRYVEQLLDNPDAAAHPLLLGSAARLLAATALATFPSTLPTDPTIQDRRDATGTTVQRAVAFIEANPERDITVVDIAGAACVTVRAVQLAFRRHLNTTPMAYLRRVRLDLAHRDLLDADPRHATVAAVANRWGFTSHSRFAALYRSTYHVLPSSTLSSPSPDDP